MRGIAGGALLAVWLLTGIACSGNAAPSLPRLPLLDPNIPQFPDASIPECSDLLSPPAGTRGFMFVGTDGCFYFQDGSRGRFWGINVAKDSVFQPQPQIDAAIDTIARAGFNLVRLHHLDDENGLLPAGRAGETPRIDPERLAVVDYWVAQLKQRGIYVFIDLLDFRTFRQAEGVPDGEALGRGAKPYALFDQRLIQLQQQFARELLFEHRNPHTGLTYAQDPAICMVELCDENGLFHELNRLGKLVEPYRSDLLRRWNEWLVRQYRSRNGLSAAWTDATGCHLKPEEDPAVGNVGLPGMSGSASVSAPRLASRNRFFADLHRAYFREMLQFLRASGLRCPVSAVTKPAVLPDLWANAQELDFISTNYYYDHPYFRPESDWQLPAFISGASPLRDQTAEGFAATVSAVHVRDKPLVIREWGVCWPNEFRSPGMLEAAAYACLQDIDAMILFTLDTREQSRKLGYFDVRRDPARWGLAPVGARMFLERQLQPARNDRDILHPPSEVFRAEAKSIPDDLLRLTRTSRVRQAFPEAGPGQSAWPVPLEGPLVSDTNQIVVDPDAGIMRVDAPLCHAAAGHFTTAGPIASGPVEFSFSGGVGAWVWQSLDGLAAGRSQRWSAKFVSVAANTGQKVRVHMQKPTQTILALDDAGQPPVTTLGEPSDSPTALRINGVEIVAAYMKNGTLELYQSGDRLYLYCDTPGVKLRLPFLGENTLAVQYDNDGRNRGFEALRQPFVWPDSTALVEAVVPAAAREK